MPYLTAAEDNFPQLPHFFETDIINFSPTFQLLTKSRNEALDVVHAQKVLHQRDFHISPPLPAMWAVNYNLKKPTNGNYSSMNQYNVFKLGKILPGLI